MLETAGIHSRLLRSRQLVSSKSRDAIAVLHQLDLSSRDVESLLEGREEADVRASEDRYFAEADSDPMDGVKSSVESPTWDDSEREEMRLHGRYLAEG